jgi:hypothetical protein
MAHSIRYSSSLTWGAKHELCSSSNFIPTLRSLLQDSALSLLHVSTVSTRLRIRMTRVHMTLPHSVLKEDPPPHCTYIYDDIRQAISPSD